jgi:folylpolyglutamate synthase/dihydropteroate synthase
LHSFAAASGPQGRRCQLAAPAAAVCKLFPEATDAMLWRGSQWSKAARGETSLTYFEMGTLARSGYSNGAQAGCLVLEVGLGGRLDAVNLLDATSAWSPVSVSIMPVAG